MKAPFAVGEVVVCVRQPIGIGDVPLVIGKKYIVKLIHEETEECYPGVLVHGVVNCNNADGVEGGYVFDVFRLYEPPKPEVKVTEKQKENVR